MEIFTQPPTAKGPAETFTGDVWVDLIHAGPQPGRARLSVVRFAPCSRSHWHSHRLGQTLHILEGTALIGSRDGTVIEAHAGDTIFTAPGEEHWHGAAPDRFMAHLVLMEGDESDAPQTIWGDQVMVIEPGAVATELTDHITNPEVKQGAEKMYQQLAITADDIAEVIAFAVTRPRRMTLNEILVRPTAQP